MKVSIVQTDIAWANPEANATAIGRMLDAHAGADLYVLPEMFSTGFATNPDDIAESDGLSVRWMGEQARSRQCAMMGSVATKEAGRFFNRLYGQTATWSTTTNATSSAMAEKTGGSRPGADAWWWPTGASEYCCRCATTCVSRCSAAIGKTMTWRCTWPTGPRRDYPPGLRCCAPAPSRTNASWWASTAWGKTPLANTVAAARS